MTQGLEMSATVDKIARALCREKCAFYGEPPCFDLMAGDGKPQAWPNPQCDEPGCFAEAEAVAALLKSLQAGEKP